MEGCPHVRGFCLREVLLPFRSFGMADGSVVFVAELPVVLVEGWVRCQFPAPASLLHVVSGG
jgi:hypothetical protein